MQKKAIKKWVKLALIALILTFLFTQKTVVEKIDRFVNLEVSKIQHLSSEKEQVGLVKMTNESGSETSEQKTPINPILDVPFICQAPLQTAKNWELHEESCEEAALLQTYLFETGQSTSKETANIEILKMIQWQEDNMGGHFDLKADKMVEFISGYYGIGENIEVINNPTIEDIKKIILQKHAIIAPVTAEMLNNPYYSYPGYHMLVIKGVTKTFIITNDNGTRRGESYPYKVDTFMAALKDAGDFIIILKNIQSSYPNQMPQ